ncbi:MAG TPA: ABC transporter permease subunit [Azospirillum sp.]|nr:ABC transporter permease subunit [Azospirillum sp.]
MDAGRFDPTTDTPAQAARRRFAAHRPAVHGVGALAVLTVLGFVEPLLAGPFATDPIVRALDAGHTTLALALVGGTLAAIVGAGWGVLAVTIGGRAERRLTALAQGLAALPLALLPVLAGGLLGRGVDLLILAVAAAAAPAAALATRTTLRARARREYAMAARAAGLTPAMVLWRHTIPNLAGPLLAAVWPVLPRALAVESFAGVVGLGAPAPVDTWGTLIGGALTAPFGAGLLAPALLLAAALAALNAVGDGVAASFPEERP